MRCSVVWCSAVYSTMCGAVRCGVWCGVQCGVVCSAVQCGAV